MPILPAEPEIFPDDLWEENGPKAGSERRWWCLHTKPRQEKALARALRVREIVHYLPQIAQESRTPGGRKIRSLIPLFPGYMFLLGDDHQRFEALQGNHLANLLAVPDQTALEGELRQIHRLLSSGLPVFPEPTLVVGTSVKILVGPLKGLVGTIVRRGERDRFVALVRFLGKGATIDLQDWQVAPIEAPSTATSDL